MNDDVRDSIVDYLTDMFLVKEAAPKLKRNRVRPAPVGSRLKYGDLLDADHIFDVDQLVKPKYDRELVELPKMTERPFLNRIKDWSEDLFDFSMNNTPQRYLVPGNKGVKSEGYVKPIGKDKFFDRDIVRPRSMNLLERVFPYYKSVIQPVIDRGLKRYNNDIVGAGKNYGAIRKGLYVLGNGVKDSWNEFRNYAKAHPVKATMSAALMPAKIVPKRSALVLGGSSLASQLLDDNTSEEDARNMGHYLRDLSLAAGKSVKDVGSRIWNKPSVLYKDPMGIYNDANTGVQRIKALTDVDNVLENSKRYAKSGDIDQAYSGNAEGDSMLQLPINQYREHVIDPGYNQYVAAKGVGNSFRNVPGFWRGISQDEDEDQAQDPRLAQRQ